MGRVFFMDNYQNSFVSKNEIGIYSFAGGAQCLAYNLITSYMMYFYVNVFNVDLQIVSAMLLFEGIWDLFNNPLAGIIVDRTRTKYGKMLPYLRNGALPLALLTVLLFCGPFIITDTSPTSPSKILFMFFTYFLWETCYTLVDVSYWGLSAAISPNSSDRANISKNVNISMNVFAAIPGVAVPLLLDYTSADNSPFSTKTAFLSIGILSAVLTGVFMIIASYKVKERVLQSEEKPSFKESFSEFFKNPLLRVLVLSNLTRFIEGIGWSVATYYYIDVLGYASLSILVAIPAAISWGFSYSFLNKLRQCLQKKQIMLLAYLSIGIVWFTVFFVGTVFYNSPFIMIPAIMAAQLFNGLMGTPASVVYNEMMAEATDYTEWKTGKRNEGLSFSMKIVTQKMSGTLSQSVSSVLLSAIGYKTSNSSVRLSQQSKVQKGIFNIFSLPIAISYILAALPFFFYNLDKTTHERMFSELAERRETNNNQS